MPLEHVLRECFDFSFVIDLYKFDFYDIERGAHESLFLFLCLLTNVFAMAATSTECLNGNFNSCREIFNKYGSQSDKSGAVELFEKACSAQTLSVSCQIISTKKSDTLKKTLDMAKTDPSGMFVMDGKKFDKIYQISEIK